MDDKHTEIFTLGWPLETTADQVKDFFRQHGIEIYLNPDVWINKKQNGILARAAIAVDKLDAATKLSGTEYLAQKIKVVKSNQEEKDQIQNRQEPAVPAVHASRVLNVIQPSPSPSPEIAQPAAKSAEQPASKGPRFVYNEPEDPNGAGYFPILIHSFYDGNFAQAKFSLQVADKARISFVTEKETRRALVKPDAPAVFQIGRNGQATICIKPSNQLANCLLVTITPVKTGKPHRILLVR